MGGLDFGKIDAERGSLTVPMSRERPGSGEVTLAFARLPSTAPRPGYPVVFLAGGPGESGIEVARGRFSELFIRLRTTSDVILLDQRGSGLSAPSLACEALSIPFGATLTRDAVLDFAMAHAASNARRLRDSGLDLDAFNTRESAADIRDLCQAIGAEKLHLVGTSYGTHLAMAVLKTHAPVVASAVLAGPEGPDHTYKLPSNIQAQLEGVETRSGAADFLITVQTVLERLERTPLHTRVTDPRSGALVDTVLGRFDVEFVASAGAADTRVIRLMPRWFENLLVSDTSDFETHPILARYFFHLRRGLFQSAMGPCMDCASGVSASRRERIEQEASGCVLGRTIDFPYPEIAQAWGVADLGDAFRAVPQADTPVLFLTGTWDCRTPASNVADLAPGLPNHQHVVIEDAGHTDLLAGEEVARRIECFIRGESVDTGIVRAAEPFRFEPFGGQAR